MTIDPKFKPWIIGGAAIVGFAALYAILRSRGGSQTDNGNGGSEMEPTPNPSKCKAPSVPCKNDPNKCYDPNLTYIVDPCSSSGGVSDYDESGEPSFMPDK